MYTFMFSLATKFARFISALLRQRQGALILGVPCSEGLDCCNAPAEFNLIFFLFLFHEFSQTKGKENTKCIRDFKTPSLLWRQSSA
jgi:hypothetical protein